MQPVPERVRFNWSVWNDVTKKHEPVVLRGVVVSWLVMPEQNNDDPSRVYHKAVAIVRGDDGEYREIDLYQLRHEKEEATSG